MEQTIEKKHPGILPLINAESGCDYHRLILPLKYMGIDLDFFEKKEIGQVVQDTKIVIFNRIPHCPIEHIESMRKQLGIKVVVDLDDYWILNPNHLLSSGWRKSNMAEQIIRSLKLADVVTCTTSLLADKIKQFNSNVHVIPNALPFGQDQFNEERNEFETGKTRFIYAGGSTHFWDIRELEIPFTKVNQDKSLTGAYFNLAGYDDATVPNKREWTKIENQFNLKGKLRNYTRYNTLPIDRYMNHYMNADVSLIPLAYNNFNRHKSNLKIIEAGCKNIPAICSNVEPYINEQYTGNSDKFPKCGLRFAKNAREWYEQIWHYTHNPRLREDDGAALGEYVRKHYDLNKVNEYRKQLFDHLMS